MKLPEFDVIWQKLSKNLPTLENITDAMVNTSVFIGAKLLYHELKTLYTADSSKHFTNKNCEHYPCHSMSDINCLFCFCPLYTLNCGGNYTIKNHIKDCSNCFLPHGESAHAFIMSRLTQPPKHTKKYGLITKITIVDKKTGKTISELIPTKKCKASSDMIMSVTTSDDQGRRVTFFMKKA